MGVSKKVPILKIKMNIDSLKGKGFGGFLKGSVKNKKAEIVIDFNAILCAVQDNPDITVKEMFSESVLHEVMHSIEEYYDKTFDCDRIEEAIMKARDESSMYARTFLKDRKGLCDENCNSCPLIIHPNSRILTRMLNIFRDEFGMKAHHIVDQHCPNLTVCYDCRIDDFTHVRGCKLIDNKDKKTVVFKKGKGKRKCY